MGIANGMFSSQLGDMTGGGSWFESLFKNPLAGAGLLNIGGSLLGGIGSLLGGASQSQKSSRNVYNLARGQMGKQVFDPNTIFANLQQELAPQFNADAEAVSKRLGLSSGVAQGELTQRRQSTLAQLFGQIQMQSLQAQSQRDLELLNLMLASAQSS